MMSESQGATAGGIARGNAGGRKAASRAALAAASRAASVSAERPAFITLMARSRSSSMRIVERPCRRSAASRLVSSFTILPTTDWSKLAEASMAATRVVRPSSGSHSDVAGRSLRPQIPYGRSL